MQPENGKGVKPRFNLSTKVVYYDSNSIPPLPGKKQSYPRHAKPRVDCWNKSMSSGQCQVKKDNDDVKVTLTSTSGNEVIADDEEWFLDNLTEAIDMNVRIGLPDEETINAFSNVHQPDKEIWAFDSDVESDDESDFDLQSHGAFFDHEKAKKAIDMNVRIGLPDEDTINAFSNAQPDKEIWAFDSDVESDDESDFDLQSHGAFFDHEKALRDPIDSENESENNTKIFEFFKEANSHRQWAGCQRSLEYFQKIEDMLLGPCKNLLFWKSILPYISCVKAELLACMGETSEALQQVENVLADPNATRFYDDATFVQLACKYLLEAKRADDYDDPDGVDDLGDLRKLFDEFMQFSKDMTRSYDFYEDLKDYGDVSFDNDKIASTMTTIVEESMEFQEVKLLYRLLNLDWRRGEKYKKEDFKKAHKVKLIKYHPDKFIGEPQEVIEQCKRKRKFIEDAYRELLQINYIMEQSDEDFEHEKTDSDRYCYAGRGRKRN